MTRQAYVQMLDRTKRMVCASCERKVFLASLWMVLDVPYRRW